MLAFALTIFTGAFLLFQVQPLIGKYILPWFGGSPGVWTTCMLFFQGLLLCGYAYAHGLAQWFKPRTQVLVHWVVIAAALAVLPISPSESWKPAPGQEPTWRILLLLLATLGLPYFVLSSTGPLLQAWFHRSCPGKSPYRLYALSNFGSLLALLSYPPLIEPALTRQAQVGWWSWGMVLFAAGSVACGWRLWRADAPGDRRGEPPSQDLAAAVTGKPRRLDQWLWFLLPACASVLLLAITNKVCQDIAVIPFLWILPLSLYLVTFVVSFEFPRLYSRRWFALAYLVAAVLLCDILYRGAHYPILLQVSIASALLLIGAMICHAETYALRPPAGNLTRFYLCIAAGGAAGGAFVAVIAPRVFNSFAELPGSYWFCGLLLAVLMWRDGETLRSGARSPRLASIALPVLALFGLALGIESWLGSRENLEARRNFYGVLRVHEYYPDDPRRHGYVMSVGQTLHGHQFAERRLAGQATTYFHEQSGVGLALSTLDRPPARRVGVIGLGVGSLATYARAGDTWRFYEINPDVPRLAQTRFTFLRDCAAPPAIVLGDGRLSLEREPPQGFDVLVLDAFSGDAIPAHLLTCEAFRVYLRHLNGRGMVAAHITNQHLDLQPVLRRVAAELGLHTAFIATSGDLRLGLLDALWVLLSPNPDLLQHQTLKPFVVPASPQWRELPLWTDEFFSLFPLLR